MRIVVASVGVRGVGEQRAILPLDDEDGQIRVRLRELVREFVAEGPVDAFPQGVAPVQRGVDVLL